MRLRILRRPVSSAARKRMRNSRRRRYHTASRGVCATAAEILEVRRLLSGTTAWVGGDGVFSDAGNWSDGVPDATDTAQFGNLGAVAVSLTADADVDNLQIDSALPTFTLPLRSLTAASAVQILDGSHAGFAGGWITSPLLTVNESALDLEGSSFALGTAQVIESNLTLDSVSDISTSGDFEIQGGNDVGMVLLRASPFSKPAPAI